MSKRVVEIKPEWWDEEIEAAIAAPRPGEWAPEDEEMLTVLKSRGLTLAEVMVHINRKRRERGLPPKTFSAGRSKWKRISAEERQ
jgi:hypothetical protein